MAQHEFSVHEIKRFLRLTHEMFEVFFQQLLVYARQHKITYDYSRKHATGTKWRSFHCYARQQTCLIPLFEFLGDSNNHLIKIPRRVHDAIASTMRLASRLVDPYPDPPNFIDPDHSQSQNKTASMILQEAHIDPQRRQACEEKTANQDFHFNTK